MKVKGIIFDFGFTLFEFEGVSIEKYMNCYKKGLQKSIGYLQESQVLRNDDATSNFVKLFNKKRVFFFKQSRKTKLEYATSYIFQHVLDTMIDAETIENFGEQGENFYSKLSELYHSFEEAEWKPFPHTRETLEKLSKIDDLKMAVLSNHPSHHMVKKLLKKYDLYHFFDEVITSAKFGKRKPDPEIFYYTLKKLGLEDDGSECMMCGDEYADIVGGYRAGLKTILCERVYKFPFEREINVPNYIKIADISKVLELFK